jgi:hypothetical protein
MQVADLDLLAASPAETLLHLHIQPPAFNAFVAAAQIAGGGSAALLLQAIYLGLTVVAVITLFRIIMDLGSPRGWANGVALAFAVSPTTALYEHTLFYTHLEVVGVIILVRSLQRWCLYKSTRSLVLFASTLSLLVLGRSLYHPVWLLGLASVLFAASAKDQRRSVALALLIPMLLVGSVGLKNQAIFGWWTTGSLEGINLHRMTEPYLTDQERRSLLNRGVISKVSTEAFSCQSSAKTFPPAGPARPIPVLDRQSRIADPRLQNLNRRTNVRCLERLRSESLSIIRNNPAAYLRALQRSWAIAWYPTAGDVRSRAANTGALAPAGSVEGALLGSTRRAPSPFDPSFGRALPLHTQWLLLVATIVSVVGVGLEVISPSCDRMRRLRPMLVGQLYLIATATILCQMTEVGENNRLLYVGRSLVFVGVAISLLRLRATRAPTSTEALAEPQPT